MDTWFGCPLPSVGFSVAGSLELGQFHSSMVPFMVYDVRFFFLSLSEAMGWYLIVCWISWSYSISRLCCTYPMLGDTILGRFLHPSSFTTFWHFESSSSFAMVIGCKGKPLWLDLSKIDSTQKLDPNTPKIFEL